jgi:hypothetical protein
MPLLCNYIPVFDETCHRFSYFVHNCNISECEVVKFVITYGIYCDTMFSYCGRNAILCSLHHDFNLSNTLHTHFSAFLRMPLQELVFIRDGDFVAPELSRLILMG